MRMESPLTLVFRGALPPLALLLALSSPSVVPAARAQAPAKPAAPGKTTLVDKVLAVVDEDPILSTDVDRVVKLGLQVPNPGEGQEAFRRRVLGELIDQRVRAHEVNRFGSTEIPVEAVEEEVTKAQRKFPDDRAFQKALAEVGLNLQGLRQLFTQQLLVLTYVDERLGANVLISSEEIKAHYDKVLTPEMRKRGLPPPPLEDVRDEIRTVIKERKLTDAMAKWTTELKAKADILVRPATGGDKLVPLPPVVKKIGAAPAKPPR